MRALWPAPRMMASYAGASLTDIRRLRHRGYRFDSRFDSIEPSMLMISDRWFQRKPGSLGARQPERGHLLPVAHEEDVAGERRVVPGLALQRLEFRDLPELVGRRRHQRQLTLLGYHQQRVLVGQQHELPVAVAPALPLPGAVLEADRRQNAAVETVGVPL